MCYRKYTRLQVILGEAVIYEWITHENWTDTSGKTQASLLSLLPSPLVPGRVAAAVDPTAGALLQPLPLPAQMLLHQAALLFAQQMAEGFVSFILVSNILTLF